MKKNQILGGVKLASVWAIWAFLAVGAVGWALFTLLEAFGVLKDGAAWVQAIGSIMAILIAIWVPAYQHDKQQKAEEDKRRAYIRVFIKRVDFDFGMLRDNKDKHELCKQLAVSLAADIQEFLKTDIDLLRAEACLELLWAFQAMAWEANFNTPEMENFPAVIQLIENSFDRLKRIAQSYPIVTTSIPGAT
ncbi:MULTISPECIES: hypothetical protein [unclassified Pseudomonas]|uniref:hypothetical protein n=1 Tax=unclassified Pseudomonas TaxID=196821 RepID=UPI000595BE4D|nr:MULTISPECIES: hypothetical protein [unclassified Pseudomonas]MBD0686221.1 hypothetical protein [Pseudomonas sp. PSB18]